MSYYTLLVREEKGPWEIAFGAYDKQDVSDEAVDYVNGSLGYKKKNTKIVTTRTARQSEIDEIVRKLNHESER